MQDYAKAILAGATNNNLAPASSPIVADPARLAAISGANASKFAANLTDSTATALAGTAGNQADLNMNALSMRALDAKQRAADAEKMTNPNNYRQVSNNAGGYDFFDPNGAKITVDQYAKVTGQNRASILKDSQDPSDVQFRNDYNNLQDVLEATMNKDKEKLDEYYKVQPELKHMKPADLINHFKAYYPSYFSSNANASHGLGTGAYPAQPTGSSQTPLSNPGE